MEKEGLDVQCDAVALLAIEVKQMYRRAEREIGPLDEREDMNEDWLNCYYDYVKDAEPWLRSLNREVQLLNRWFAYETGQGEKPDRETM